MDIDNFELDEEMEKKLNEKHQEFIDNQEEIEASNDCEGGACII
ncbi:hypothetical protein [Paenalcaligenes suwonensis]|nr:hypothetical protein [Paenalcaligenes suwonensis]